MPRLIEVAKTRGPLQDDAVLALGKMGDKAALETLAELQRTGSQTLQPSVAAAICLLGSQLHVASGIPAEDAGIRG